MGSNASFLSVCMSLSAEKCSSRIVKILAGIILYNEHNHVATFLYQITNQDGSFRCYISYFLLSDWVYLAPPLSNSHMKAHQPLHYDCTSLRHNTRHAGYEYILVSSTVVASHLTAIISMAVFQSVIKV